MRPHDIVCRCCGIRYNDCETGCDICLLAKKNIIWPKEDLPYIPSLLDQTARVVEENLNRLEKDMKQGVGSLPIRDHQRAAKELTAAMVALSAEVRKREKENRSDVRSLSIDQKLDLLLGFLEELAPEHKQLALERITNMLRAPQMSGAYEEADILPYFREGDPTEEPGE